MSSVDQQYDQDTFALLREIEATDRVGATIVAALRDACNQGGFDSAALRGDVEQLRDLLARRGA